MLGEQGQEELETLSSVAYLVPGIKPKLSWLLAKSCDHYNTGSLKEFLRKVGRSLLSWLAVFDLMATQKIQPVPDR